MITTTNIGNIDKNLMMHKHGVVLRMKYRFMNNKNLKGN
jgi:hypothetical protein